jgi:predicted secreted protein
MENGQEVRQTSDGGYIIAGQVRTYNVTPWDAWLIRTDVNGDAIWTKVYGGSEHDLAYPIIQTTDGGYLMAGGTQSFGAGNYDMWSIKTNANGDSLWSKTYGGVDRDECFDAEQTADGGYILAGRTYSFGAGNADAWLIRTDVNGDALWTKTYGGPAHDWAMAVHQTSDGGYVFVGSTESFGSGDYDVWVIRTDANGDTLWTQTYGGTESETGNDGRQTSDGGYIVCGQTHSFGSGQDDVYLIKIAADAVPGFIRGIVTDQYNGLAIPDVVVDLYNASGDSLLTITTTDNTGF